jgi:hypothetical protein
VIIRNRVVIPRALLAEAATVHAWGIDYSHGSGLTIATMKANGVQFCCRYVSTPGNTKNINAAEFANLQAAGIAVVFNFETTGNELGFAAGARDAVSAEAQAIAAGAPVGTPIVFSPWDHDPTGHIPGILDYGRGTASVLGHDRAGLYQGYPAIKAYLDAKVGKFGWQTYAWSGGVWDPRAQLQQYQNGVTMGPAQIDRDRAMAIDYGQTPRPSVPVPPRAQMPGTEFGPARVGTGWRWTADGTASLADVALHRGASVLGLLTISAANMSDKNLAAMVAYLMAPGGVTAKMPHGLVFYTAKA